MLTFTGPSPLIGEKWRIKAEQLRGPLRQSSVVPSMLVHEIRKLEQLQEQLGNEANRALEVLQKEVACHRQGNQDAAETIAKLLAEIKEMHACGNKEVDIGETVNSQNAGANLKEEITRLHSQGSNIANLEEQLENVQKSIDKLIMSLPANGQINESAPKSSKSQSKKKKMLPLSVSTNVNRPNIIRTPCSPLSSSRYVVESEVENKVPDNDTVSQEAVSCSEKVTPSKSEDGGDISSKESTPCYRRSSSVNMKKMKQMFQNAAEENIRSIKAYVTELKERVAKLQYQKQLLVCQVLELEANDAAGCDAADVDESATDLPKSPNALKYLLKEQMEQIIQLWHICHVSIIHRTQFYLLFKGDPADQIYVEVELNRLTWMQKRFAEVGDASPAPTGGSESSYSLSSSIKALRQEREFLSRRLNSRMTEDEREHLYAKWQIPLEGKQRKLQLVNMLWTDPDDPIHTEESASIVAKLVGFCEAGNVTREMFELNFALPASKKQWIPGWEPLSNLLRL